MVDEGTKPKLVIEERPKLILQSKRRFDADPEYKTIVGQAPPKEPVRGGEYRLRLPAILLARFGSRPIVGVEVGVLLGRLSFTMLRVLPGLTLVMVDGWQVVPPTSDYWKSECQGPVVGQTQAQWDAALGCAIRNTDFAEDRRVIIKADMLTAARLFGRHTADFVFLDAEHTEKGTRDAIDAWAPAVKPGGLLCGHDIDHPQFPHWGVREAVEGWMRDNGIIVSSGLKTDHGMWFCDVPIGEAANVQ